MVPEVAGLSVEEIEGIFNGPWYKSFRPARRREPIQGSAPAVECHEEWYVFISFPESDINYILTVIKCGASKGSQGVTST